MRTRGIYFNFQGLLMALQLVKNTDMRTQGINFSFQSLLMAPHIVRNRYCTPKLDLRRFGIVAVLGNPELDTPKLDTRRFGINPIFQRGIFQRGLFSTTPAVS